MYIHVYICLIKCVIIDYIHTIDEKLQHILYLYNLHSWQCLNVHFAVLKLLFMYLSNHHNFASESI